MLLVVALWCLPSSCPTLCCPLFAHCMLLFMRNFKEHDRILQQSAHCLCAAELTLRSWGAGGCREGNEERGGKAWVGSASPRGFIPLGSCGSCVRIRPFVQVFLCTSYLGPKTLGTLTTVSHCPVRTDPGQPERAVRSTRLTHSLPALSSVSSTLTT